MKALVLLLMAVVVLVPAVAFADAATDAALGLGAFAVFNQILAGTGVFGYPGPVVHPPAVVVRPAPVYVAPPAVYVAPAYVYPWPRVVRAPHYHHHHGVVLHKHPRAWQHRPPRGGHR
jgi:hypothetical protein